MISFEMIEAFLLLPLPLVIYRFAPKYLSKQTAIKVPFFHSLVRALDVKPKKGARELKANRLQKSSILLGWVFMVIAAAKPVWMMQPITVEKSGRELMVLVDLSGSMDAKDFSINGEEEESRLDIVKRVLTEFSHNRQSDRLGLIVFGDSAFLQSPFTQDHHAWLKLLEQSEVAMAGESTHLGDAIGLGIKTFIEQPESETEKVMILLTDGNDTDSLVPPIDAAKVAASYNIRIHVVAMGSPMTTGEEAIDLETIKSIADITGGKAFMAMSPQSLEEVYQEIDTLEPALFDSYTYRQTVSLHHYPLMFLLVQHLMFILHVNLRRSKQRRMEARA